MAMHAMMLESPGVPLRRATLPVPAPSAGQILVRVLTCGVCRTDLHITGGELRRPKLPLVMGHQIVGVVAALGQSGSATGATKTRWPIGTRVGIPWLGGTCGVCVYCQKDRENLCAAARFTGYDIDGGYAEYAVADERYCFELPPGYSNANAAPLLCAGLIGYRSLRKTGDAQRIGLYGFGAAAHIVAQVARYEGRVVFAFVRPGDTEAERFARQMGAAWAGASDRAPPAELDAAIVFASAGELVPRALRAVARGGIVVTGGIHMSDIPSFPYEALWGERVLCSVTNLTRNDAREFMALCARTPIRTEVTEFALADANRALAALKHGEVSGAAVLTVAI